MRIKFVLEEFIVISKMLRLMLAVAGGSLLIACDGNNSSTSSSSGASSSGSGPKPIVRWILPTPAANAGAGADTTLAVAVSIEFDTSIKSVSVGSSNLWLNSAGLWAGTVKLPAEATKISLTIKDAKGTVNTVDQPISNTLYSGYPRAVEFDRLNNRLLLSSWSSERLLALDLTTKKLKTIPITDTDVKNKLARTQFLKYSTVDQSAYFAGNSDGGISKLNTISGQIVAVPNSTPSSSLCVDQASNSLFSIAYSYSENKASLTEITPSGTNAVPIASDLLLSTTKLNDIICTGNKSIAGAAPREHLVITMDLGNIPELNNHLLDLRAIAPTTSDSQTRIKPFGSSTGYLVTLTGDNTAIYKADNVDAIPQLINRLILLGIAMEVSAN